MFSLPKLNYGYDALEPYVDAQTMQLHHGKHHQTYVDKLNAGLEGSESLLSQDITDLLSNFSSLPEDKKLVVRNHGGGHHNHTLFWESMCPGGSEVTQEIKNAIKSQFGSFDKFKADFSSSAAGLFGSGWAWLVDNQNQLEIITTPNQDSPFINGQKPLLGLDVWEHAYYLKYQNRRPEYIDAWWQVVNWDAVEKRLISRKV